MFDYPISSQPWRNSDAEFSEVCEIPFDFNCTPSLFDIFSNVPILNVTECGWKTETQPLSLSYTLDGTNQIGLGRYKRAAFQRLSDETGKLHYGTPSGIDNSVITYARPFYFARGEELGTFQVGRTSTIVIGDTGITRRQRKIQ